MLHRTSTRIILWLIVLAMPFLLGLGTIRAVITWDYPAFEYPRIQPDSYGFSPEERLLLAQATLDYLRRPEPAPEVIYLLEELRIPGTGDLLYLESEIGHMLDVKLLADAIKLIVSITSIIVLAGLALLLASGRKAEAAKAILNGGLATAGILLAIGLLILLAWSFFFVQFHQLLFPPGSWTFAYSDSLIRLFPEQFWFDFGVLVSGATFVEGSLLAGLGFWLWRRLAPNSAEAAG